MLTSARIRSGLVTGLVTGSVSTGGFAGSVVGKTIQQLLVLTFHTINVIVAVNYFTK